MRGLVWGEEASLGVGLGWGAGLSSIQFKIDYALLHSEVSQISIKIAPGIFQWRIISIL